jgi:serine protease Do
VTIQPLTPELAKGFKAPETEGALVAAVQEHSPAAKAGLKAGDIITEYDEHRVARSDDLPGMVAATPVGGQVSITVLRDGKPVTLNVKVGQLEETTRSTLAENEDGPPLGLMVETLTPSVARELGIQATRGVVVRGVRDSSPAAAAGVHLRDVITEVDHRPVTTVADMKRALAEHPKDTPVLMRLVREGTNLYVALDWGAEDGTPPS